MTPSPRRKAEARDPQPGEFSGCTPHSIGRLGEDLILETLEKKGFQLLGRNLRVSGIELDLVLLRGGHVLVVEVKTRIWPAVPEECLRDWQRGRLHRALPPLSRKLNRPLDRMDLVLAAVRLRSGHEPEICFFRIPLEPRRP